jgi:hypothetical protein
VPYRRYAPAWLLASTLLLLVAIAPSRGAQQSAGSSFAPFDAASGAAVAPGTAGDPAAPGVAGPAAAGTGGTTAGAGGSNGAPTGATGAGAAPGTAQAGSASGDTSHCRDGKQFALPGFIAAPPCQPRFTGGDNGGATYPGVTKTSISVVYYRVKPNAAVQGALGGTGLQPTPAQLDAFLAAEAAFIAKRYELWGRKVQIAVYESPSCQASPPSDDCFRQDARALIAKHKPFAVIFPQNGTAPGFQDELSKAGVVNFGGLGLPGSFNTSRRPFRYDHTMDGDTQATLAGEFYCKRLANDKAAYAGDTALSGQVRKAQILVPDSEFTVKAAQRLQSVINRCDKVGATIKTYAQDTSQAASQSTTLASQAKQNGITTILWFSDPVLPVFLTPQMTSQNFFPENVTVGTNFLDYDPLAQLYDQRQWANTFGLGNLAESQDPRKQDAYAAYRDGGGSGEPYLSADGAQGYFSILAAGLQQAGARLDPGTFERGVLTLPTFGGDRFHSRVDFGPGDYTGQSDARVTAWDPDAISPVNGKRGAYVPLDGGRRYAVGQFPTSPLKVPRT